MTKPVTPFLQYFTQQYLLYLWLQYFIQLLYLWHFATLKDDFVGGDIRYSNRRRHLIVWHISTLRHHIPHDDDDGDDDDDDGDDDDYVYPSNSQPRYWWQTKYASRPDCLAFRFNSRKDSLKNQNYQKVRNNIFHLVDSSTGSMLIRASTVFAAILSLACYQSCKKRFR